MGNTFRDLKTKTNSKAKRLKGLALDLVSLSSPKSRIIVFTSILLILAFLPTEKLYLLPVRSLYEIAGIKMYSIGITRSVSLILHGQFQSAWHRNPLGYLVLVVVVVIIIKDITEINRLRRNSKPGLV